MGEWVHQTGNDLYIEREQSQETVKLEGANMSHPFTHLYWPMYV